MSADRPNFAIGPRGHFCGGCEKTQFLHTGCVTDNSYQVSPDDPQAVASRMQRDIRLGQVNSAPAQPDINPDLPDQ